MRRRSQKTFDAVVAGYVCVDMTPRFPRSAHGEDLLRPGKLIEVDGVALSLGGAVANTGLALSRFGQTIALMGLVGDDALGDFVLRTLKPQAAATRFRRTPKAGTGCSIVLAPPGRDRLFLESPGCNRILTADDIDYGLIADARLFHFGYPPLLPRFFHNSGRELARMFRRVREAGVTTSLDMTLPDPDSAAGRSDWRLILRRTLPFVDIFAPSIEELLCMADRPLYERMIRKRGRGDVIGAIPRRVYRSLAETMIAFGARIVMIKAGQRGAYLRTGEVSAMGLPLSHGAWADREIWAPPFPVNPRRFRNACGAGDAAVAGFLAAVLKGETPDRSGALAMLAGRDSLYGTDALQGLRDWKTMKAAIG